MFSMNATQVSASRKHHQRRLRLGVGGVVLEVQNHAKLDGIKFGRPVALFADIPRGYEAIAFHAEAIGH